MVISFFKLMFQKKRIDSKPSSKTLGGEFVMGDASEDMQLPEHLMDNGQVVVVTVNYRSGPLGYLCLESEKAPGNLVRLILESSFKIPMCFEKSPPKMEQVLKVKNWIPEVPTREPWTFKFRLDLPGEC